MKLGKLFLATIFLMIVSIDTTFSEDLTSEKKDDIKKLLDMTGALALGQQMANQVMLQLTQNIKARRPNIPQGVIEALRQEVNGVIRDNLPAFADAVIPLYHKHFTHEDIRGLINFYSTDLGKKAIGVLPLLMQDSMRTGQQWGQSLEPEIQRRILKRLKAEGIELARGSPNRPLHQSFWSGASRRPSAG